LSGVANGAVPGKEHERRALAAALGYPGERYEDFLEIGRAIAESREPVLNREPKELLADVGFNPDGYRGGEFKTEPFNLALSIFTVDSGDRAKVASACGLTRDYVLQLAVGQARGSEKARRRIAAALGYPGEKFEEFLELGRAAATPKAPAPKPGPLREGGPQAECPGNGETGRAT
jgi:hypothetical protein